MSHGKRKHEEETVRLDFSKHPALTRLIDRNSFATTVITPAELAALHPTSSTRVDYVLRRKASDNASQSNGKTSNHRSVKGGQS